ncbi:YgaP family membrane protein [Pseudomonas sp. NPDC086278]|uniref:YgaP family membrane protein n=1 Tax=Pseudomonas sp. NPDC086278 TaxID=3390646 RepID=UPI003D0303ED
MSELKRVERIEHTPFQSHPEQNVHGWERVGSLAGGVVMMGKGLRRGGIFGLIQVAIGGVALARGITGHSSAKSLLEKSRQDMNNVRAKIERAGEELNKLKANAEAATKTATVTGNDSLNSPKAGV